LTVAEALQQVIQNGVIPVKLEEEVVRFRVGRLYASAASGFRELYANELRACRIARDKYGAKPRIEITANNTERTITIHGVDSLGITEERFITTLCVLGETDNIDGAEVGQFGWGMAAAATLSDSVVYETYARETGERYAFLGIAGQHFSKLPEPNLNSPGTRVTVYLRDNIDILTLLSNVRRICAYSDIDTSLVTLHPSTDPETPPEHSSPQQLNNPDIASRLPYGTFVEVDDADFKLAGVFTPSPASQSNTDIRLLDFPVDADIPLPFDSCVLKVKDERKYPPTADRERLTDAAVENLSTRIDEKLRGVLPRFLDINSFDEFRQKPSKYIYPHLNLAGGWRPVYEATDRKRRRLCEVYTPSHETCEIARLLTLQVRTLNRNCYYPSRKKVQRSLLADLVAKSRNLFLTGELSSGLEATLRIRYPDALLFAPIHTLDSATATQLRVQGIRTDTRTEAEDIKLSQARTRSSPRRREDVDEQTVRIVVHHSRVRQVEEHGCTYDRLADQTRETLLSEAGEDTILVPNIEKYLPVLTEVYSFQGLSRLDKIPKALQGRRLTLDRFLQEYANHTVTTNHGYSTFEAVSRSPKTVRILLYGDPRLAAHLDSQELLIPLSNEDAFKLAVYLRAKEKTYKVEQVPSEEEFEQATGMMRWHYDYHEQDYRPEACSTVNMAYHVALAVKDDRLRRLFFGAAKSASTEQLQPLRDFTLSFPAKCSREN
jgi:hypothetical protein